MMESITVGVETDIDIHATMVDQIAIIMVQTLNVWSGIWRKKGNKNHTHAKILGLNTKVCDDSVTESVGDQMEPCR